MRGYLEIRLEAPNALAMAEWVISDRVLGASWKYLVIILMQNVNVH